MGKEFSNRPKIFKNRDILSPNHIPEKLRYRDQQYKELTNYFGYVLDKSTPPHLLLLGPPGSGKTATIQKILKLIRREIEEDIIIGYTVALGSGYQTLITLARDTGMYEMPLTGLSFVDAWRRFEKHIEDKISILILDEMDKTISKDGCEILYCMSRRSKTSIIGISNKYSVLDLIEDPRVKSSYTPQKIMFPHYNAKELSEILKDRIAEAFYSGILVDEVIPRIAALAAKRNGDARYALDLLMFSGDAAVRHKDNKVTTEHVDEAKGDVETAFIRKALGQLRQTQKLLLYCTLLQGKTSPTTIYTQYNSIAQKLGLDTFTSRRLADFLRELELFGFVDIEKSGKGRGRGFRWEVSISNTIDREMLTEALRGDELLTPLVAFRMGGSPPTGKQLTLGDIPAM